MTMPSDDDISLDDAGRVGECYACERIGPVDDLGLCDECAAELDRDLIRQRAWDYAAAAFGVPPEQREALRERIIAEFGAAYELIAPEGESPARRPGKRRKYRRHHRGV
ncbi:MAG TPA: hypothetical protein PKH77_11720 [Anaerolineae bacterium]|nr:hypothetical protein [Anaerolineae bacterium]